MYADFIGLVRGEEVAAKADRNITTRTSLTRFPFGKSLEVFDFTYQPSLDKKQLQQVATCHFIEHGENVVIPGPPWLARALALRLLILARLMEAFSEEKTLVRSELINGHTGKAG